MLNDVYFQLPVSKKKWCSGLRDFKLVFIGLRLARIFRNVDVLFTVKLKITDNLK